MAKLLQLCKKAFFRRFDLNRLGNDGGDFPRIGFKILLDLCQIVVVKLMHELPHLRQNTALTNALRRRCPFMPTVILPAHDMLAPRIATCDADSRLRRRRAGLEEADFTRAWDMLYAKFCVLHFLGSNKRVAHSATQLRKYSVIYRLVLVAKQDGSKPHVVVDVFVTIGIPDMPIFAVVNIDGRHPLDMGLRALAIELTP